MWFCRLLFFVRTKQTQNKHNNNNSFYKEI
jgi:hypothetical protein